MNVFLKYTSPSWDEVLTEQAERNSVCSENSRKKELLRNSIIKKYPQCKDYLKYMDIESLYRWEYQQENLLKNQKKLERILKYGHPKKCPIINRINNLIIF